MALVQLHSVINGGCTCGDSSPEHLRKSAGKHPVQPRWTTALVLDEREARQIWESSPWNVGIATGAPSGFWALDYDPDSATPEASNLFARYRGLTREHRTGSGGYHLLFAMPPDAEVRNQQGGEGRNPRLPKGIDVRGTGGQIVAPPSITAKGLYVAYPRTLTRAPADLEELVVERRPSAAAPAPPAASALPAVAGRWGSYALRGIAAECEAYGSLIDGRRGEAAAAFFRRVVELANLAGMPTDVGGQVYELAEAAADRARHNTSPLGGYAPHEVEQQWQRAREYVGGRAAIPPPAPDIVALGSMPPLPAGAETPVAEPEIEAPAPDVLKHLDSTAALEHDERLAAAFAWVEENALRLVGTVRALARARLKSELLFPMPEFDRMVKDAERAAAAAEDAKLEAQRRAEHELRRAELSARGVVMPAPNEPLAVARALAARRPQTDGILHETWWRGDFYQHTGAHWQITKPAVLRRQLYIDTEHAVYDAGEDRGMVSWKPDASKINSVLDAMATVVLQRDEREEPVPVVACTNGVVDPATGALYPHHPGRFNLASLPFPYDPYAVAPTWTTFLEQVLPSDPGAQAFLQEWCGYLVSGRTDQQKIANLYGKKRSGKGTIGRVLRALIGEDATASPSLAFLARNFGGASLIGSTSALLTDVNWAIRDITEAVELIKKISGEDGVDLDRKGLPVWKGKLGVRFTIVGNDVPKFPDPSGALLGRMIHLHFRQSFYGREDIALTQRLMAELPGILNWSLAGLARLSAQGRFTVPESSISAAGEIRRATGTVAAFLDDRAIEADAGTVPAMPLDLNDVYAAYRQWALHDEGVEHPLSKDWFARDLRSAGIDVQRKMVGGKRSQFVFGLLPAYGGALSAPVIGVSP